MPNVRGRVARTEGREVRGRATMVFSGANELLTRATHDIAIVGADNL